MKPSQFTSTHLPQVYRTPIPVSEIQVEDLPEVRVGGSFKRTFSTTAGETSKNFFRVWEGDSQGYTLSVQSGTKKQWIDSIMNAKKALGAKVGAEIEPSLPAPELPIVGNDDVIVEVLSTPTSNIPTEPASPPIEFITPQAKQTQSRSGVDYTPTTSGGKKLREEISEQTPSSRFPVTPTCALRENKENCESVANQMTPLTVTTPKLTLRTDEHVLRLVIDEAPTPVSPSLGKTSRV